MKQTTGSIIIAALMVLAGCGGGGSQSGNAVLNSIQLSSAATSVPAGLTMQITATGAYSDGSNKDVSRAVSWTSSDTNVATVDTAGVVTGRAQGPVTISASSSSVTGTMAVSVKAGVVRTLTGITPASATIAARTQQQFTAVATLSDGTISDVTRLVTWTISPANVGSISNMAPTQGLVTAGNPTAAVTEATLTATCSQPACVAESGTPSLSASLTVTNATPTSIAIAPTSKKLGWGNQLQFTATGSFSDGTKQDITNVCSWVSSNPALVFVTSSSGLAVGKSIGGPAYITAAFGGVSSNAAAVTVDLSNLVSISLAASGPVIAQGTQITFSAMGTFNDGSVRNLANTKAVVWTSSITSVATIDANNGLVQGVGAGRTTIKATAAGISGSSEFDVANATLQSIAIAPTNSSIAVGTLQRFNALGTFGSCSQCPFDQALTTQPTTTWSASSSVASITSSGVATGNSAGTTNIRASSSLPPGNVSAAVPLTVTSARPVAINVSPANTFVPPGASISYQATGLFSDNSSQNITDKVVWSTSNPAVATITYTGQATAQGQGNANITAKLGSTTGTTSLLVTSSTLTALKITPANSKVAQKTAAQFKALGIFADGSTQDLTYSANWGTSNQAVASIGVHSGILTALVPGTTTVTANFGAVTGKTAVTVTNATLTSILILPSNPIISANGGSVSFSAKGNFSDGTTQALVNAAWSSSNPGVAIVSSWGLATASGVGTTTISATLNGVKGTAVLTVQ